MMPHVKCSYEENHVAPLVFVMGEEGFEEVLLIFSSRALSGK